MGLREYLFTKQHDALRRGAQVRWAVWKGVTLLHAGRSGSLRHDPQYPSSSLTAGTLARSEHSSADGLTQSVICRVVTTRAQSRLLAPSSKISTCVAVRRWD
jgi:hypothetical protein